MKEYFVSYIFECDSGLKAGKQNEQSTEKAWYFLADTLPQCKVCPIQNKCKLHHCSDMYLWRILKYSLYVVPASSHKYKEEITTPTIYVL